MEQTHNHIHLFGDPEENFYILGKRDKDSYQEVYQQISMLCTRNQYLSKIVRISTELSRKIKQIQDHKNLNEIRAYAEGLERSVDDVLFSLLLPEIVASFNKWTPELLGIIPGCSSLFMKDSKTGDIIHSRILDYALAGPFERHERSILYDFADRQKVFSFSTSAMPFPSLTATNEKGLSLALHYKHGQYFNMEGQSIFFITSEIMYHCANIREAIKYLKSQQSVAYWGIYLADKQGEVASIDIRGPEFFQEKFDLKDHSYLYFNNRPLLKKQDQNSLQPFGNSNQCTMRRRFFESKMKTFERGEKKNINLESLKILASPPSIKKLNHAKDWILPTITPSSIQVASFNLTQQKAYFIPGNTPKFYRGEYLEFKNIFNKLEYDLHKKPGKKETKHKSYLQGMQKISQFQSALDIGDIAKAYHEIQMAIVYLRGLPEEIIASFYFAVIQYIYENDTRDLTYLFHDFESLEDKLPAYLEDHRLLFMMRLSKIIGHQIENNAHLIQTKELKKVYHKEYQLNALALKALRYLIYPRIEILDIIYAY